MAKKCDVIFECSHMLANFYFMEISFDCFVFSGNQKTFHCGGNSPLERIWPQPENRIAAWTNQQKNYLAQKKVGKPLSLEKYSFVYVYGQMWFIFVWYSLTGTYCTEYFFNQKCTMIHHFMMSKYCLLTLHIGILFSASTRSPKRRILSSVTTTEIMRS